MSYSVQMCGCVRAGDRTSFPLEALTTPRVTCHGCRQDLDRHHPIQAGVSGLVNFSHATRTDWRENFVRAEPRASTQRHVTLKVGE